MKTTKSINGRNLFQFGILIAAFAVLYSTVFKWLVDDWINLPDFSHGFLIPGISLYLIFQRRKDLAGLSAQGVWSGMILLIIGILILLLGNLASEYFLQEISMLVVLSGIILFLWGKAFYKILFFPLAYLIFMIPLPSIFMNSITFPLQLFASRVAGDSLHLLGIPVLREGNVIQLANTTLEVAEACSGIRSLISLLALSVILAYFTQNVRWKRILLVLFIFPIAIFANAVRVSGTGILAHFYGEEMAQGFFHGFSGYLLFIIAFICLLAVSMLLTKKKKTNSKS